MKFFADLHTHTLVSHHAYSTLRENCLYAARRGMRALATTDHGYGAPDAANDWHFGSMWILPREMEGVLHLRGAEANIMDMDGNLDLRLSDQRYVDWLIASLHTYCVKPKDDQSHTNAYLKALDNPYVDVLGHPASLSFPFDEAAVVRRCAETGKILEINAHAMLLSPETVAVNKRLLSLCKRYDARIAVGSDAHVCYEVATFDFVQTLLEETGFPEALVLNADLGAVLRHANAKPYCKDPFDLTEVCL